MQQFFYFYRGSGAPSYLGMAMFILGMKKMEQRIPRKAGWMRRNQGIEIDI